MRLGSWMMTAAILVAPGCFQGDAGREQKIVRFVSERVGWAVGAEGLVLHTVDGGKTWVRQESGVAADLRALAVTATPDGRYVGVAAGDAGVLLRTGDGVRWSRVDVWLWETLRTAAQSKRGSLLLVGGDAGTLLRSEDFGASWSSIPLGSATVVDVRFDSTGTVALAADDAGALWESRDRGMHFDLVRGSEEPVATHRDER